MLVEHEKNENFALSTLHSTVMTFFQVPVSISKCSKFSTAFLVNVGCTNFPALSKVSVDTDAGNWASGICSLGPTEITTLNTCLLLSRLDDSKLLSLLILPSHGSVLNSLPGLKEPETAPGKPKNGKRNNWLT